VLSRERGWFAAIGVTLATAGLIACEVDDRGFRRWWAGHPLTTDTVAGLLVLLITVLVVDQVVRLRQVRDRARATAAQAAIVMAQASRSAKALSAALASPGEGDAPSSERDAAGDELRTYAMMLLVAAPLLIEAKMARDFLEEAQRLAGEMARVMAAITSGKAGVSSARMDDAARQVRAAATPLLAPLRLEELIAVGADQPAES
jgi:hypothetical protein